MSSKRRIHRTERNKKCVGKHKHETQADAVAHVISLKAKGERGIRAYACNLCHFWHVGHNRRDI